MSSPVVLLVMLILGLSGYILKYGAKFDVSPANCKIPLYFILFGTLISTQLRDFREAIIFLLISILLWASYVFGSRLRQRGSFFWNVMASLGSNGLWFVAMHVLDAAKAYWLLFVLYTIGIIAGRIAGVGWAQYIEQKFKLKGDATSDPKLAPGQRLKYIKNEPTFWILAMGLIGYIIYSQTSLEPEIKKDVLIVIGLGILQNFFYALSSRAGNRGNNWYIAITGICSGLTFYVSATYLFARDMPMILFIPYVLSTSLGSATGAFFSMIIEWVNGLKPDSHLEEKNKKVSNKWKEKLPYVTLLTMAGLWILFQESIFNYLDYPLTKLKFPLSFVTAELPRWFIILTASLLFFVQESLHTLTSRAGNRNHTGYHVATMIPKGLVDFLKVSYLSLNSNIPEVIPVAVLSSCLGSLYGKDISQYIEKWLEARMDIEPNKTKPAVA